MTTFTDIPIKDIDHLLKSNGLNLFGNKYLTAWNFILIHPNVKVPVSFADWLIAYNLLQKGVNIPTITPFDIITSRNEIITGLNLSDERIINVMRFLHKLDERDMFKELPNEIIAKILSELDYKKLILLCNLSKQFKFICDNYLVTILKEKLKNKYYNVDNINSSPKLINILRTTELNKRVINLSGIYLIIGKDGKLYEIHNVGDKFIPRILFGMEDINIIGIVGRKQSFFVIDVNGNVYFKGSNMLKPKKIDDLKNIIQIVSNNTPYFLDDKGNVYEPVEEIYYKWNSDEIKIKQITNLSKIIKIVDNEESAFFLTKEGKLYSIDKNVLGQSNTTLTEKFNNVKDICTNNNITAILTNDGDISVFGTIYYFDAEDNALSDKINKIFKSTNVKKLGLTSSEVVTLSYDDNMHVYVLQTNDIGIYPNIKDFEINHLDEILILDSENIISYNFIMDENIDGDVQLFGDNFIIIDGVVNLMEIDHDNGDITLHEIIFK